MGEPGLTIIDNRTAKRYELAIEHGFPVEMFPVLFAIARTSGWLAQWLEMTRDPEQKIARPRQLYLGAGLRDFVPLEKREPDETGLP